jgi:Spy/CpxP family protein refolding chaperone
MTMKRSIAVVYVVGLFLLGILIGALGMHLYQAIGPPRFPPPGGHDAGRPGAQRGVRHFIEQLDLTDEQAREIRMILDESRRQAREMHEEMLPRVHALMEQTHRKVAEILTPEQREQLESMTHQRRILERLFLGHGPPEHGPLRGKGRGSAREED